MNRRSFKINIRKPSLCQHPTSLPWAYLYLEYLEYIFYMTETRPGSPPDAPPPTPLQYDLVRLKTTGAKTMRNRSFCSTRSICSVPLYCIAACVWISVKAVNSKMSLTITEAWIRERVQLNHDNLGEKISLFNYLVFHLEFTFVAMSYLIELCQWQCLYFDCLNVTRLRDHHCNTSGSDAWLQLQQCWRFAPRPRALQTQEMISGLASLHCCWFTSIHNLQFMQR